MSKTKEINVAVNETYKKHFNYVQVSIMKLPEIHKEIEKILSMRFPEDIKNFALQELVEKYRIKTK